MTLANGGGAGLTIYGQLGVNADGMRFGNEAASAGAAAVEDAMAK